MTNTNSIIILLIIFIGFFYYYIKLQSKKTDEVGKFFIAEGALPDQRVTDVTWSTSIGFGTSMFVAIYGGYQWGLATIWLEVTWALGTCGYALLLPSIVQYTKKFTLHGYLGSLFGDYTRYLAGFVSLIGLLFATGFELSFAGGFFGKVMGLESLETLIVVLFALLLATYCSIGGYVGNAYIDKFSNHAAWLALVFFLAFLVWSQPEGLGKIADAGVYGAWQNFITPNISDAEKWGFILITFYQFIDMTNWQTVAASRLISEEDKDTDRDTATHVKSIQWAIVRASIKFMWAPALVGTTIGYYFKQIAPGVEQNDLIPLAFKSIPQDNVLSVIFAALILFGLMSSVLGATNSWLLASVQTISWDMMDYNLLKCAEFDLSKLTSEDNHRITRKARIALYVFGIMGSVSIYYLSTQWSNIFQLQFVMFGAGLTMAPWLLYGCLIIKGDERQSPFINFMAFITIFIGLLMTLAMYFYGYYSNNPDVSGWIPLRVLAFSCIMLFITLIPLILRKFRGIRWA
jgi:hypothetical protein